MYIADGDYIRDIEVNDLRNRYTLTKGSTQKTVNTPDTFTDTPRGLLSLVCILLRNICLGCPPAVFLVYPSSCGRDYQAYTKSNSTLKSNFGIC